MEGAGGHTSPPPPPRGGVTPLRAGILAALLTLVADQASKLWLLNVFDLARRGAVR